MGLRIRSVAVLSLACGLVSIAAASQPGFYFGLGGGATNFDNNKRSIQVSPGEYKTITPSNTGIGERLFFGYNISPYGAFEMGYAHYGSSTYKVPQSIACNNATANLNGFDMEGKGMLPFGIANVFAKAGIAVQRQTLSGSLVTSDASISPCGTGGTSGSTTSVRPLVGVGIGVEFAQNWAADLSITETTGGGSIKAASFAALSLSYHFNDKYCGQFIC